MLAGFAVPEPLLPFDGMRQPIRLSAPVSFAAFARLAAGIVEAGYAGDIEWSESVQEPQDADGFAREAIFVICNSGMRFTVAQGIFNRVMEQLLANGSAHEAFGHKGKSDAIDRIWRDRERLLSEYRAAPDKLAFCESLPFIGGITKYHLAKNFGADVAKPDVHLQRLADWEGTTPQALCDRLAKESGYRASTVDLILWRACAIGLINSRDLRVRDRSGEAVETVKQGSTEGESPTAKPERPKDGIILPEQRGR